MNSTKSSTKCETMDRINMPSSILPPGFRFHPTDQELMVYYLEKKITSSSSPEVSIIADVNIYKYNPWELPGMASFGEHEWFFFSPRDRKYPNGSRPNRAAASGYWKATGTDKPILTSNGSQCLGVKKTLVFYKGRPPQGIKTTWMMLEYRLLDDTHRMHRLRGSMRLDDWVLCRISQKTSTPQQIEDKYDSSSGSSYPYALGCRLQGQEGMLEDGKTLKDHDYDIQASLMAPLEGDEANHDQRGQFEFQEGSPGYSVSPVNCNSQTPPVSSFKEALDSLTKVIPFGTFEELVQPPKKRPNSHMSAANNTDNTSIFQVSSPAIPASFPRSFSEFLI